MVERTAFDCPNVWVTEQDNLVMISTPKLTANIHLEPFYVEVQDKNGKRYSLRPGARPFPGKGKS